MSLMGGRRRHRGGGGRRTPSEVTPHRAELAHFDQGPWPAVAVPSWPPHLIEIVERLSGRRFDADLFRVYELARGYCAYPGPTLTAELELATWPGEPPEDEPDVTPSPRVVTAAASDHDPYDLGD